MPKPVAGRPYTIVPGDNLSKIAAAAYGNPREWRTIWKANKAKLRSGNPNLIFPGEVLWLPEQNVPVEEDEEPAPDRLEGKDLDDFTIIIEGLEVPVVDGKAFRSIDTVADGFSATIPWDPTRQTERNKELIAKVKPYGYKPCECYLGGELMMTGRLYAVGASIDQNGVTLDLEGWSHTADLVDSTVRPPYEAKKVTLEQRATSLLEGFAIDLDFRLEEDEPFDKITIQPTDTIFNHLLELARQRKALVTSDAKGRLVITQANTDGGSVYTLEEGRRPLSQATIRFDGRARFNSYTAISQSPRKKGANASAPTATAKDDMVPAARMYRFQADDTKGEKLQEAADWERSRRLADGLKVSLPVDGWQVPGTKDLWKENTIVTLKSASLFIPDGYDFLIRSVEYSFSESGAVANLELVPPETFTGEPLKEPWL
jgi:prophage tail gpP-like protein